MDEFSPGMGCMSCAKGKFLQAHPFSYPLWAQPKDPIFNKDTAVGMGSEVHKHVGWAPPTSGPEDLMLGMPGHPYRQHSHKSGRKTCLCRHWTSACWKFTANVTFLRLVAGSLASLARCTSSTRWLFGVKGIDLLKDP